MDKLAINGGTPVRTAPFPTNALGAAMIDQAELKELTDVVFEQSPFRFYGLGNPTKAAKLEELLRDFYGRKFALAVSSGSAALACAMAALGLGPGDEVILSAFTWYSDYMALVNLGILPVFADIDETLAIDPADFEKKITPNTKAVIVVNFQGGAANMDEICRIAKAHDIKIIEDSAQAMGCCYHDKKIGTFGDITILSFQAHKVLTAGEGGAIITDNETYFARAVRYHDLGSVRPFFAAQIEDKSLLEEDMSFAGLQFRMSELQAAFLVAQFGKIDTILSTCRKYQAKMLDAFKNFTKFRIRYTEGDCGFATFLFFDTVEAAQTFKTALQAEGISVGAASACANLVHRVPIKTRKMAHPAMGPFGAGCHGENAVYNAEDLAKTDDVLGRCIALTVGPKFADSDVDDIITAVEKVYNGLYA